MSNPTGTVQQITAILRHAGKPHPRNTHRAESLARSGVIAVEGKLVAACGCVMSARTFATGCNH